MQHYNQINRSNIAENRLVFVRHEYDQTEHDMGTAEAITGRYDKATQADNLNVAYEMGPEHIALGIRDRALDTINDRSLDNYKEARTNFGLTRAAEKAPAEFKRLLEEEILKSTSGVGRAMFGGNIDTWKVKDRERLERKVAARLFTYNMNKGESYKTLLKQIRKDIKGLKKVGGMGSPFLDGNGVRVDLGNTAAKSLFYVTTSPSGAAASEVVSIDWHKENIFDIKEKLQRCGRWIEFFEKGKQKARDFFYLKFRQSLIENIAAEEGAKLSSDRFNGRSILNWLDNEWSKVAADSANYNNWFATYSASEGIAAGTSPDLLSQRQRDEIVSKLYSVRNEELVKESSLKNKLAAIVGIRHLEDLQSTNDPKQNRSFRTLVSYIFSELHDPERMRFMNNEINNIHTQFYKANKDKPEKDKRYIDPYVLLTRLIRSQENCSHELAGITANMLYSKCKNEDIHAATNEHIAKSMEKGWFRRVGQRIRTWRFFSPIYSAKDILQHVVDISPELHAFAGITPNSTLNDLNDMMVEYERNTGEKMKPRVLSEFAMKLGKCLEGFTVEGKQIRILNEDALMVEHVVDLITKIEIKRSTVERINKAKIEARHRPEMSREDILAEVMENWTDSQEKIQARFEKQFMEGTPPEEGEAIQHKFPAFFLRRNISREYNRILDDLKDSMASSSEIFEELVKEGLPQRVLKRIVEFLIPEWNSSHIATSSCCSTKPI